MVPQSNSVGDSAVQPAAMPCLHRWRECCTGELPAAVQLPPVTCKPVITAEQPGMFVLPAQPHTISTETQPQPTTRLASKRAKHKKRFLARGETTETVSSTRGNHRKGALSTTNDGFPTSRPEGWRAGARYGQATNTKPLPPSLPIVAAYSCLGHQV
jgi:hypothetical protein